MSNSRQEIGGNAIIYQYPTGDYDIVVSSDTWLISPGWEASFISEGRGASPAPKGREKGKKAEGEDALRSMRRARAKLRRLALSNDFRYFVTLTLDREKVDRYDPAAIMRKVNKCLGNLVQRHGLRYILVPERHKDGAYHFHGFFAGDGLVAVDSGTIRVPWDKKPRRPRSEAERAEWLAHGGHVVYNLPQWPLGFSTALELYGEYSAAVAYVCKYIGKEAGERPMGRWYYSGGKLAEPAKAYAVLDYREVKEQFDGEAVECSIPGTSLLVVHHRNNSGGSR